jgi:hypothetical protein
MQEHVGCQCDSAPLTCRSSRLSSTMRCERSAAWCCSSASSRSRSSSCSSKHATRSMAAWRDTYRQAAGPGRRQHSIIRQQTPPAVATRLSLLEAAQTKLIEVEAGVTGTGCVVALNSGTAPRAQGCRHCYQVHLVFSTSYKMQLLAGKMLQASARSVYTRRVSRLLQAMLL